MDEHSIITILTLISTTMAAIGASSGFWLFMEKRRQNRTLTTKLLLGLAHDRIVCLALKYLERGFITQDEHENLYQWLYKPYKDLGGNGSADRLMNQVDKLHIFNPAEHIADRINYLEALKGERSNDNS